MIRILACILIIAACSMIGLIYAEELKKRSFQLREFQSALLQLQNEIIFTHTPLPEAFIKLAEKSKNPISKVFRNIGNMLLSNKVDNVFQAFSESFKGEEKEINLSKNDIDIILDMAKALGESDIDGHKKIFLLADNNLKNKIEEADCLVAKNAKLYRYLGFSFGAVVAILLI